MNNNNQKNYDRTPLEIVTSLDMLWEDLVSPDSVPPRASLFRWLTSFDEATIQFSIAATGRKLEYERRNRRDMDAESLARYCSACCRNTREQQQAEAVANGN